MKDAVGNILAGGSFVAYVGISYICLGVFLFSGYHIDAVYLTCLSITAALLTIADNMDSSRIIAVERKKKWYSNIIPNESAMKNTLNLFACMFMIFIPNIPHLSLVDAAIINSIGSAASLISLGVAILIIGKKSGYALSHYRTEKHDLMVKYNMEISSL